MALMKVIKVETRAGQRAVERLRRRGESTLGPKLLKAARRIVQAVRHGGDRALLKAVRTHDRVRVRTIDELRLRPSDPRHRQLPAGFESALERAISAVERYHEQQIRPGFRLDNDGIELVCRRTPLKRVGIYIPGGRAAYPSSAVMTVLPARLAGVAEIAVATPPGGWERSDALHYALERLGVTEIWGMGGAQAISAMAYGTESVRRVDKIVGPGNAWVTAAKYLVSADVAIDGLAGPSEVVIVADEEADPKLLAADLLAQAEHDPLALALLVTDQRSLIAPVQKELKRQLAGLATASVARAALRHQGAILLVKRMEEALELVESLAPEHLQLVGPRAEALSDRVRAAGAVFVGASTPEVFGDYTAGPSHVLPTGGTARYASSLGVEDFVRRSHLVRFDAEAAARNAAATATLADAEGLPAHAAAARMRLRGRS